MTCQQLLINFKGRLFAGETEVIFPNSVSKDGRHSEGEEVIFKHASERTSYSRDPLLRCPAKTFPGEDSYSNSEFFWLQAVKRRKIEHAPAMESVSTRHLHKA